MHKLLAAYKANPNVKTCQRLLAYADKHPFATIRLLAYADKHPFATILLMPEDQALIARLMCRTA